MRARLLYMKPEIRNSIGVSLWQIFPVLEIKTFQNGYKYPRQSKQVFVNNNGKRLMFYWYEVELLN